MSIDRRTALTTIAVLPALAVPIAAIPDADVEAACRAIEDIWQENGRACDMLEAAERGRDESAVIAARTLQGAIHDRLCDAEDKLASTRATTLHDLRCKARISHLTERGLAERPIAQSIVNDLIALSA
jgi:hypothetical protein